MVESDEGHRDEGLTYAAAGVDIEAGEEAVRRIAADVASTRIPGCLGDIGGFGALFELPTGLRNPVLVGATDGVGTKVLLAQEMGRINTVGIDLVAMSVNDVVTLGAKPLFFLDYIATGRLVPDEMAELVAGVAEGCRRAGCALVGGEMAEMPGLYSPTEFDLAGFCVGLLEKDAIIDGSLAEAGDVVLGLSSSGVHSNGYSLVRRILESCGLTLTGRFPLSERTVGEDLLEPTRIYVKSVFQLLEAGISVRAMAHVTGGGLAGNLGRVIPEGLSARLRLDGWQVPHLFRALQELGSVSDAEMYRTFNMGVGFVLVVARDSAQHALQILEDTDETVIQLGRITRGKERVSLAGGA